MRNSKFSLPGGQNRKQFVLNSKPISFGKMIRKPYFSLFLLCLPLFSLCSSGNDDPAPAPAPGKEWLDPIRVATYNIQYDNSSDQDNKWTTRRDLLRQLLQSEKFDIFGAQEPYLTQIKDIEP